MKNLKLLLSFIGFLLIWFPFSTCKTACKEKIKGLDEFINWTGEVKKVLASHTPAGNDHGSSVLGKISCGYSEIGDGYNTQSACMATKFVTVDSVELVFIADWAMSDPQIWHADADLNTTATPDCNCVGSAIQIEHKENLYAIYYHCQMLNMDHVLLVKTKNSTSLKVAFIPMSFLLRYPDYISGIGKGME